MEDPVAQPTVARLNPPVQESGLLEALGAQPTVARLNPPVQESEVVKQVFLRKKGVKQHDIMEKEKFHAIACSPAYVS
ncbi:hypothetical protein [Chroococcidiopsis sp. SAG 2025]|uniref:hypothetical protein n=1 Tax=Chroococcidiopsis sp. SAG 2025 TaxID=171389 RepID=UPI002936E86E|nr:hypothetical protein [Chroococcidiopsis sp. SAG 2025]